MVALVRIDPFRGLVTMRGLMDQLMEDGFFAPRPWTAWQGPRNLPLDVQETEEAVVVRAAVPGVKPEEVELTVEQGRLTIRMQTRAEHEQKENGYLLREIRQGAAARTVVLPAEVVGDGTEASLDQGILTVTLPKVKAARPARIAVKGS